MQKRVADILANYCGSTNCPFILDLGDNFYPEGVLSPTDPKFDSSWRNIYNHPALINVNWYISIGNRDYIDKKPSDGRELHQVGTGLFYWQVNVSVESALGWKQSVHTGSMEKLILPQNPEFTGATSPLREARCKVAWFTDEAHSMLYFETLENRRTAFQTALCNFSFI